MSIKTIYKDLSYKSISSLAKYLNIDQKSLQRWMRRNNGNVNIAVENASRWRDNPQPQIPKNRKSVIFEGMSFPSVKIAMRKLFVVHLEYSTVLKRMKKGQEFEAIITNPKIVGRRRPI